VATGAHLADVPFSLFDERPVAGTCGYEPPSGTNRTEGKIMWDTAQTNDVHLSHDMPCALCGHDVHTFLPCGADCACAYVMPGRR
jgi:hypothetical protein